MKYSRILHDMLLGKCEDILNPIHNESREGLYIDSLEDIHAPLLPVIERFQQFVEKFPKLVTDHLPVRQSEFRSLHKYLE